MVGYNLHKSKKTELKNQIYSKIDRVFDGKTVILDGQNSLAVGELKETVFGTIIFIFAFHLKKQFDNGNWNNAKE